MLRRISVYIFTSFELRFAALDIFMIMYFLRLTIETHMQCYFLSYSIKYLLLTMNLTSEIIKAWF